MVQVGKSEIGDGEICPVKSDIGELDGTEGRGHSVASTVLRLVGDTSIDGSVGSACRVRIQRWKLALRKSLEGLRMDRVDEGICGSSVENHIEVLSCDIDGCDVPL